MNQPERIMNWGGKTSTAAVIALLALGGILRAEREFFVFDNGLSDIKSAGEQAALLQRLGYDGICTRPERANDDFFTAMDRHGIKISATYLTLPAKGGEPQVPPHIADHIRKLKGRNTIVWLALTDAKAADEAAVSVIRKVCDLSADIGLDVVLYPHVGLKTRSSAECERLRKLADRANLGVSFNLCHFLCQDDPAGMEAALKPLAPHLKLVQISGADEIPPGKPDWQRLIQPLGQGTFDIRRVIRTLDQIGYKGPVNLQCYQIKQPASQHLAASMEAWKNLNKDIIKP
jgi:sugar phosphate isomerase/epimerase